METKKKLFFPLLILCMGIVLCVSLSCIFYTLKKTKTTSDSTSTLSSVGYNVYFVYLNECQIDAEATALGKDIMSEGFSGYVWQYGEKFYCTASAYKNENDARLVSNKLEKEGKNSKILKVSFPQIKISSTYSSDERQVILSALNIFHDSYLTLYDLSISLENTLLSETNASLTVNNTLSQFSAIKKNFDTLFPQSDSEFTSIIKNYLISGHETLSLLSEKVLITPSQSFCSIIKYRYCEILDLNRNLLSDLLEVD